MKQFEGDLEEGRSIDPRLEDIVMRMFDRCLADRRYKQAIGIAFETRHIDVLERALRESVSNMNFLATKALVIILVVPPLQWPPLGGEVVSFISISGVWYPLYSDQGCIKRMEGEGAK